MLSNILAPLADDSKGNWPPPGVDPALTLWYEAVARIRVQLMHWTDKQNRHIACVFSILFGVNKFICELGDYKSTREADEKVTNLQVAFCYRRRY
ncbi:putative protein furry/Tao3/Mor2 [Helianthus annuus]|nr:putative protein furry/Tao3/Mor2 [Helianthus annuus]KAJ0826134.1 putative protein furry/Tao3/Mor2 [Helianthus annuus]